MAKRESPAAPEAASRFDGRHLREMFSAATRLFESNVDSINALNVFPVPDGDTGTNMFLTLREVTRQAEITPSDSASEVAAAMARGALLEARGNSGVILCQFLKGLAVGLGDQPSFSSRELASALASARDHAYKAVGEPVEGTMLTVITSVADAAQTSADDGATLREMFGNLSQAARDTVALTPTMLPILREAGVVDAGGQGLGVILEGASQYASGQVVEPVEIKPPEPIGVEAGADTVSAQFLKATEEELYGYCTQFLVEGEKLDLDRIREAMTSLAQSIVVVGDEAMCKVHAHAEDPGPVISYAVSLGNVSQVKMQNMGRTASRICGCQASGERGFVRRCCSRGGLGDRSGDRVRRPGSIECPGRRRYDESKRSGDRGCYSIDRPRGRDIPAEQP